MTLKKVAPLDPIRSKLKARPIVTRAHTVFPRRELALSFDCFSGTLPSAIGQSDNYGFGFTTIERFSFECRKVIGFASTALHDWLKKLALLFHPIRSKTKTNCHSLALVFPRFASVTCNYFKF